MKFPLISAISTTLILSFPASAETMPFGDTESVNYAKDLWSFMERKHLVGVDPIITRPYQGAPPHGMILELLEVPVTFKGTKGDLVVKRNYGGDGLSIDDVINNPQKYLKAVTIMFKRDDMYDPNNQNWFYVKYAANGKILTNPKGAKLAGRVAEGMPTGCIACHASAEGNDFIFNHDRYKP
ncbi:cytochrome P460 family protein [Neptuniibacter sp. QD37_6]|uniref:cytochrome P460 family protein n=1 Tax=Neptuniibacter sp. QD37_6 TaxID=3398210 RepID=UPI0039F4C03B